MIVVPPYSCYWDTCYTGNMGRNDLLADSSKERKARIIRFEIPGIEKSM